MGGGLPLAQVVLGVHCSIGTSLVVRHVHNRVLLPRKIRIFEMHECLWLGLGPVDVDIARVRGALVVDVE